MGRKILAVVVGLIGAIAVIMIVEMLNSFLIMPPSPEVWNDRDKLREFMAGLPTMVYGIILTGYVLGSLTGGFLVANMARRESPGPGLAIFVGAVLTLGAIVNFFWMLPGQPIWFVALSLLSFIPLSLVGYKLAGR